MAKTKKAPKTSRKAATSKSRKAAATKKKTSSPKKKATVKKATVKKASAKRASVKKTATAKKSAASSRGKSASRTHEADGVTIESRDPLSGDRRNTADRRRDDHPVVVNRRKLKRREKVNRRRQIDPTTCERDYTPEEIEFMQALDEYKRKSGRMFPTCSEILEVIQGIGYAKRPALASSSDTAPTDGNPPLVEPAAFADSPDSLAPLA